VLCYLDELLEVAAFTDYGPIGLQVVGADRVRKVCVAVSASLDVFERAGAAGAQLLVVHHGLFWDGASRVIGTLERRRLEALFRHDLTLAAYHLPLDAHPEVGNNARLIELLGVERHEPFAPHRGRALGRHGTLPAATSATELAGRLEAALGVTPRVFAGGPRTVRRIGVVSGGAGGDVRAAAELGLDLFVTGEPEEESPYLAAELGIHFVAAGHNATETVGVRALAERLERDLDLETAYLPVDNPV
jgi:dinuclear metal center YbgI/SA1388 family protein